MSHFRLVFTGLLWWVKTPTLRAFPQKHKNPKETYNLIKLKYHNIVTKTFNLLSTFFWQTFANITPWPPPPPQDLTTSSISVAT
jgi:hypothetical protein